MRKLTLTIAALLTLAGGTFVAVLPAAAATCSLVTCPPRPEGPCGISGRSGPCSIIRKVPDRHGR